jgi:hypothetical protein
MATWNAIDLLGAEIDEIDSSKVFTLGQTCKARHITGLHIGEFMYLQGVASLVAGEWVSINPDNHTVAKLADGHLGGVAIAMAATVASKFGWFQVKGKASGLLAASVADNAGLYTTATAGTAGATAANQSEIIGARAAAASGSSAANTEVEINYPVCGLSAGA